MSSESKELKDINVEDIQFLIDNQIKKHLEDFLEERRKKVVDHKERLLFISATPRIVKDDRVDVFDSKLRKLLQNPPRLKDNDLKCCSQIWKPNLYGIKAEIENESMEVLRNGHMELIVSDLLKGDKVKKGNVEYRVFDGSEIVEYLVNLMLLLKEFLASTSISEPVFISVALLNTKDIGMSKLGNEKNLFHPSTKVHIWTEGSHLILPSTQISSKDDPYTNAKVFADRIWNAFRFERAPFFNDQGNFIPPN